MSSAGLAITLIGISMCTGPGRPHENSAKARASAPGRSAGSPMRSEDSATFSIMPRWSGSSCR
jgi:hypothetical protein